MVVGGATTIFATPSVHFPPLRTRDSGSGTASTCVLCSSERELGIGERPLDPANRIRKSRGRWSEISSHHPTRRAGLVRGQSVCLVCLPCRLLSFSIPGDEPKIRRWTSLKDEMAPVEKVRFGLLYHKKPDESKGGKRIERKIKSSFFARVGKKKNTVDVGHTFRHWPTKWEITLEHRVSE